MQTLQTLKGSLENTINLSETDKFLVRYKVL